MAKHPHIFPIAEEGSIESLPSTFSPWQSNERLNVKGPDHANPAASAAPPVTTPNLTHVDEAAPVRRPSAHRISSARYSVSTRTVSPLTPAPPPPLHRSNTFDSTTTRSVPFDATVSPATPGLLVSAPQDDPNPPAMQEPSISQPDEPRAPHRTKFTEMLRRSLSPPPRRDNRLSPEPYDDTPSRTPDLHEISESYAMNSVDPLRPQSDFRSSEEDLHHDDLSARYARAPLDCHSRRDVYIKRWSWLYVILIILSVYSTLMSGLWFVVSIYQPRYGRGISSGASLQLAPSTATLLCTLLAKTIELSFVTVFVAFLGQVLTRRAFNRNSHGMTLAEMTMRNWVIQPGSLLTHWEGIPHTAATLLGALTLTATIIALFYTTASDAMVSPKLKFGSWESRDLQGLVKASYANPLYVREACTTPIDGNLDPLEAAPSCLNVQYSGQSYHNLLAFMKEWELIHNATTASDDENSRPTGKHNLFDNTTLTSAWIEREHGDVAANFAAHGRIIDNVTIAMPHPGVYTAATDPVNGILQPSDLSGVGEYSVQASVVSPAANVLCANVSPQELAPLVYTQWPDARNQTTEIPGQNIGADDWFEDVPVLSADADDADDVVWLNRTAVDDVFLWGPAHGRRPPVFQMYPIDFNMITNTSVIGSDAVYILGKSDRTTDYTLCELRSWPTSRCSTHFDISGTTGGAMRAHCEDEGKDADTDDNDDGGAQTYARQYPDAPIAAPAGDWRNLADQWRLSMDLNGGVQNNNASNARILTNLILTTNTTTTGTGATDTDPAPPRRDPRRDPRLPSMAEALAVLASSTLVVGSLDTTYQSFWPHGAAMQLPAPGVYERFRVALRTQEYTSSHVEGWQAVFYPVLGLVLALNIVCLVYLVFGSSGGGGCCGSSSGGGRRGKGRAARGLVTDYTEPQNLFAVAVNSPPSRALAGSCGHGPDNMEMMVPWRVAYSPGTNHYFFEEAKGGGRSGGDGGGGSRSLRWRGGRGNRGMMKKQKKNAADDTVETGDVEEGEEGGRFRKSYHRLSSSRTWL
ncbi:hypothetical protein F4778DRAFT_722958 [Xylariomycetidae sp. FL2044]|nr:hypothetical protein F4778DRAFT_722958 [Xylariomycetidae sp. FL2044]